MELIIVALHAPARALRRGIRHGGMENAAYWSGLSTSQAE
jgi:hypothetical protein